MLRPVAAGKPLTWSDVAYDANVPAVKLRMQMEQAARPQQRSAA
jgi:predicted homoserine dehydrogenase-like protein